MGLNVSSVCGFERQREKLSLGHLCLFMHRICFLSYLCMDMLCVYVWTSVREGCVCVSGQSISVLDGALVCWHITQCARL